MEEREWERALEEKNDARGLCLGRRKENGSACASFFELFSPLIQPLSTRLNSRKGLRRSRAPKLCREIANKLVIEPCLAVGVNKKIGNLEFSSPSSKKKPNGAKQKGKLY